MKRIVLFCLFSIPVLWSCQKKLTTGPGITDTSRIKTLVEIKEVVKDSIVRVPADSSWLKALLECDSSGEVLIKQIAAYKAGVHAQVPKVSISGNMLSVFNPVDSFLIYLKWKERDYFRVTDSTSKTTITLPPVRVNYVTWWQKLFIVSGKIAWCLLLLFIARWVIKTRFKTISKWVP